MNFFRLFLLLFLILPSYLISQRMINFYLAGCGIFLGVSLLWANSDINKIREKPEIKNLLSGIENQFWSLSTLARKKENLLKLYDFFFENHKNSLHIYFRSFNDEVFYLREEENPTEGYLNQHREKLLNTLKQRDQFGPFCFFTLSGCLILYEFFNTT